MDKNETEEKEFVIHGKKLVSFEVVIKAKNKTNAIKKRALVMLFHSELQTAPTDLYFRIIQVQN